MTGIAYFAAVFAMLWIGYWLIDAKRAEKRRKPARRSKFRWWPFEYRTPEITDPDSVEQPQLSGWRGRAGAARPPR